MTGMCVKPKRTAHVPFFYSNVDDWWGRPAISGKLVYLIVNENIENLSIIASIIPSGYI